MASKMATAAASLVSPAIRTISLRAPRVAWAASRILTPTPFIRQQIRRLEPSAASMIIARAAHSIPRPSPPQPREPRPDETDPQVEASADGPQTNGEPLRMQKSPYYQLTFTCVPCNTRSSHDVSKQGYHSGSVLITCPECRNRHVISDHLGIFGDRKITVEDLLREKGQLVKRGSLGEDGDIEFWPDDTAVESSTTASRDGSGQS